MNNVKLEQLTEIINLIQTPIILVNEENNIIDVNDRFYKVFGYVIDDLMDKNLESIFIENDETDNNFQNKSIMKSLQIFGKNNEVYDVLFYKKENVCTIIDITNQSSIYKNLINKINILEKSKKQKSEYLINMSHELRSPLNSIIGYTTLLKKSGSFNNNQLSDLNVIEKSGNELLNIINDIIDIAKIESDKIIINKKRFLLKSFVSNIIELTKFKISDKELDFKIDVDEKLPNEIYSDELRLAQVLINLIDNAVKYTEKGYIKLVIQMNNGIFHFTVEDSGIGIDKKNLKYIFRPFNQKGKSTQRKKGTGLGLAISEKLVKMMGGEKINVVSTPGKGSTFSFNLEFQFFYSAENGIHKDYKMINGYKGDRKKILIIDDSKTALMYMNSLLFNINFDIYFSDSGFAGYDRAVEINPDLIFLDLYLDDTDGFTIIKLIRKNKNIKTKIIIYSSSTSDDIKEKCFMEGADDFISKPAAMNTIYNILETYLKLKWIYKDDSYKDIKISKDLDNIKIPPKELAVQIIKYGKQGNLLKLEEALIELDKEYDEYKNFVYYLYKLLKEYNVKRIRDFINDEYS